MTPPDIHRSTRLTPNPRRMRALYQNHVIADSEDVITLEEEGRPGVHYFPRDDVSMEYMSKTGHSSQVAEIGEASYYTLLMDGAFAENAVWSYEDPLQGMEAIRDHVAFDPEIVEVYELAGDARDATPLDKPGPARI